MSDNTPYYGDQATVLPSNTSAILHFSNLFAQQEKERQVQKAAQQKAEQQRKDKIDSDLSVMFNNPAFKVSSDYQPAIDNGLSGMMHQSSQELLSGVPVDVVKQHILDATLKLKEDANKVNEGNKNIAAMTTFMAQKYPGLDPAALAMYAKKNFHFTKDQDGNDVLRDFSQLKPNDNHVADAYHNHYENLFTTDAQNSAVSRLFDSQKLQDVGEDPTYDANHNLVSPGYKGKLSPLVTIKKDANGKTIYRNGSPVTDIAGSANYRMPDQQTDYVDENGKKVPTVSDDVYRQYYSGALGSGIEKQVKDQINKANSGGYQIGLDSSYADMLRKSILYQELKGEADNRYKFATPADKSAQLKHQAFSEYMQRANLNNSNARLGIAEQSLKMRKDAVAAKNPQPPTDDFLSTANDLYGKDVQVANPQDFGNPSMPSYGTIRVIPTTADPRDLDIMAGKPNKAGIRPVPPKEFKQQDGTTITGWQYIQGTDNSGKPINQAVGDGNTVNGSAVQREYLNHLKKGTETQLQADQQVQKSIYQKVAGKVKSFTNKFKGTGNKMYH
jgi:hypothetical protein